MSSNVTDGDGPRRQRALHQHLPVRLAVVRPAPSGGWRRRRGTTDGAAGRRAGHRVDRPLDALARPEQAPRQQARPLAGRSLGGRRRRSGGVAAPCGMTTTFGGVDVEALDRAGAGRCRSSRRRRRRRRTTRSSTNRWCARRVGGRPCGRRRSTARRARRGRRAPRRRRRRRRCRTRAGRSRRRSRLSASTAAATPSGSPSSSRRHDERVLDLRRRRRSARRRRSRRWRRARRPSAAENVAMPHAVGGKVDRIPNERAALPTGDHGSTGVTTDARRAPDVGSVEASSLRRATRPLRPSSPSEATLPRGVLVDPTGRRPTGPVTFGVPLTSHRHVATSPLRIAVLAPIAWRTPPRHYGPWELFASLLTDGLVAAGHDVTLFATADSVTTATLRSTSPRGWSEDDDDRPQGRRVPAHRRGVRARRRLRHHPQRLRLPAAHLQRPRRHRRSSPRSTASRRRGSCRCTSATTRTTTLRRDQRRRPPPARCTTPPRSTTASTSTPSPSHPRPGRPPAVLRPDPPGQGHGRTPSRSPRRAGRRLVIAGIVQDQRYFDEQVAPHLDGDRVRYIGPVDRRAIAPVLGARPRPAAPHRLRRAVRLQRRRGDGLRHAGDRLRPRLDGRAHHRRRRPASSSRASTRRCAPSTWPVALDRAAIRAADRRPLRPRGDGRALRRRLPRRADGLRVTTGASDAGR